MQSAEGKVILLTGGTSGLGKVAAIKLAGLGARVLVTYRDKAKAQGLKDDFSKQYPNAKGSIDLIECDLSSFKSIALACNTVKQVTQKLDAIANNAGVWNFKHYETEDGIEGTLQVNLLAPKLIIDSLIDLLENSDEPKVINTASALHQGTIDFNDIELKKSYNSFKAYRQSKLGIILLTRLYHERFKDMGINFYSQHPGLVDTELVRKAGWLSKKFFKYFGRSPEKGAETLIHLLITPANGLKGGEYYKDCKASKTDTKESNNLKTAEMLDEVCNSYLSNYH